MEKKIQDYLHLYLKSKVEYRFRTKGGWSKWFEIEPGCVNMLNDPEILEIQLSLRPLSSMTEEEANEGNLWASWHDVNLMNDEWWPLTPEQFHWLLSRGFDLFDLIPSGLAIDKTIHPPQ